MQAGETAVSAPDDKRRGSGGEIRRHDAGVLGRKRRIPLGLCARQEGTQDPQRRQVSRPKYRKTYLGTKICMLILLFIYLFCSVFEMQIYVNIC